MTRRPEDLEAAWLAQADRPRDLGTVHVLVQRLGQGRHATPGSVQISVEGAVAGDRWADGDAEPDRQVTLMDLRVVQTVAVDGQPLHLPGDNLIVDMPTDEDSLPVGARLRVGDAVLEVTAEPHLGCYKFRERFGTGALRWVNDKTHRHRRLRGVNCKVLQSGRVALGDVVRKTVP